MDHIGIRTTIMVGLIDGGYVIESHGCMPTFMPDAEAVSKKVLAILHDLEARRDAQKKEAELRRQLKSQETEGEGICEQY